MTAACEKQKLVYILNRDGQARLTISSPLEAHKSNTIHFSPVGMDVGFENPVFAVIELDYEDADADPTGEAAQDAKQAWMLMIFAILSCFCSVESSEHPN